MTVQKQFSHIKKQSQATNDSEEEIRGFVFPGVFEITAFGVASSTLEEVLLSELATAGAIPDLSSIRQRPSKAGNYLAISVSFQCESRTVYDLAYARVRGNPAIKWTL